MVLQNTIPQNLVFTNKTIKSNKQLLIRFLIAFVAAIAISFIFNFEDKSVILLMIGSFVGLFMINYNTYNKVILNNETISFRNIFTKKENVFTYSEITLFKSNIIHNQFEKGTATNVIELAFGNQFSTTLDETNYDNFDELKLFILSKVKP